MEIPPPPCTDSGYNLTCHQLSILLDQLPVTSINTKSFMATQPARYARARMVATPVKSHQGHAAMISVSGQSNLFLFIETMLFVSWGKASIVREIQLNLLVAGILSLAL